MARALRLLLPPRDARRWGRVPFDIPAGRDDLERDPFHFSDGLTRPDDDQRVITNPEPREGSEYVAGLWVDRKRQHILLTWVFRREVD